MKSRVIGDKELMRAMRGIAEGVSGPTLDEAIKGALEPMRALTEDNARERRQTGRTPPGGHLDQGVVIAPKEKRGRYRRVYWISFARRARKLAHLVEFGTAPHWQPNRGIMHPGARPYPFFRPAYESEKQRTLKRFAVSAWEIMRAYTLATTRTRRRR